MIAAINVRLIDQGFDWPAWITLGIIGISAIFALCALRDAKRTRHGQLVSEIQRWWNEDPDITKAMKLYARYKAQRVRQTSRKS